MMQWLKMIQGIQANFKLKYDKVAILDTYLGAQVEAMTTATGTECWTMLTEKYCREVVKNVESWLSEQGK